MTITDQLTPTEYGFRVRATDEHVIVRKMLFNWRLIVSLPERYGIEGEHGFCYFGRTEKAMHRAVAAASRGRIRSTPSPRASTSRRSK